MPAALAASLAVVALPLLVSCASGAAPAPSGTTVPPVATRFADSTASGGVPCARARPHAPGTSSETLTSGGIARAYLLHVPPQYDGVSAMPLVLNFHGFSSNAREQAIYSQLPAKGDAEGFVVVTPDGVGEPQRWNILSLPDAPDDIAFVRDLLAEIETRLCIEASSVFAAGMSNGAAFASRLACEMPERFVAVAAVTALIYPRACPVDARAAVIGFHGTADACVPFEGGQTQCGGMLPVRPIEEAARDWARHDGCQREPSLTDLTASVRVIAYSECDGDRAVVLYVVEGGGHTWPGAIDVPRLGETTHEINATDLMWEFFAGQAALRE